MYALENVVRDYAWGSTTALPELLGQPPDGEPQAELWIGAHPKASSRLVPRRPDGRRDRDWPATTGEDAHSDDSATLVDLVSADPDATLGAQVAAAFGARLPFLLKVLAVERPLSLQAHPDRAQAQAGYAAEEAAGVASDAPERTYGEPHHKPEMLWALTEFDALCGFRPLDDTLRLLSQLDVPGLRADVAALSSGGTALDDLVRRWLTWDEPRRADVVSELRAAAQSYRGEFALDAATLADLAASRPSDGGVLVAALLNRIRLNAEEAVYLPPGNLHAYLHGTGVEIQANSDNVLRGGLTDKYVDVDGLLDILDPTPGAPAFVRPSEMRYGDAVATEYDVPVPDFRLTALRPGQGSTYELPAGAPQVLLALRGALALSQEGGESIDVGQGRSVFIGAGEPPVRVGGEGLAMRASTGRALVRERADRAG